MHDVSHLSQISKSLLPSTVEKQTHEMANSPATRWQQQIFGDHHQEPGRPQLTFRPGSGTLQALCFPSPFCILPDLAETSQPGNFPKPSVGADLCSVHPRPLELPPRSPQLTARPLSTYWLVFHPVVGHASRCHVPISSLSHACIHSLLVDAHCMPSTGATRNQAAMALILFQLFTALSTLPIFVSPVPIICDSQ